LQLLLLGELFGLNAQLVADDEPRQRPRIARYRRVQDKIRLA
jgi:hypothetical protein